MAKRFDEEQEIARLKLMQQYEDDCFEKYGSNALIAGMDEVGRGPLAGPVVAACVVLPRDCMIYHLNDSKKLTPKRRSELDIIIREKALYIGIGIADEKVIDDINILQATYSAMRMAVSGLGATPDILLNDAVTVPGIDIPQIPIIKGDSKSVSIAAASIIAKVYRDELMQRMDEVYPGYDFASNKGYGTAKHIEAIRKMGPCSIHRRTFISKFI